MGLVGRARNFLGLFTTFCGFFLMWSGAVNDFRGQQLLQSAQEEAMTINPSTPSPANNGKLVVAPGIFSTAGTLGDQFIKPAPYIVLKRNVEMYQWAEEFFNKDDPPTYLLGWYSGQRDFFKFREPQGHENPLPQVFSETMVASDARFSGFDGVRLAQHMGAPPRLPLTADVLVDSGVELKDDKIVIRRDPTSKVDSLGDMRVWYEAAKPGDYTVMTVQQDERSLVGAKVQSELIIREGHFDAAQLLTAESREVRRGTASIVYVGGVLFWVGLMSIFGPIAHRLDLRPRIQLQGGLAALFLSSAITLLVMIFFLALATLG
jgi:hypothetical protein